jgi:signal transduction histidine kinase
LSSGSVPGSSTVNVVRHDVARRAEDPAPQKSGIEIVEEWKAAGLAVIFSTPGQEASLRAFYLLPPLVHRLMGRYFRLEGAERKLALRVRERRRGSAWKATRQIERERQRLGRELHTGVGQMLAAVRLQLDLISAHVIDPPASVRQAIERISILVRDALEEVRSISKRLHPPDWQRLDLAASLRLLWGMSGVPETYQSEFEVEALTDEPDLDRKILIYRCLQEALSNITRHSRATRVSVRLAARDQLLVLTVADNGVGFDARQVLTGPPGVATGIGLQAVREHAAALGGTFQIQTGPVGTKLELAVPFPEMRR